MAKGTATSKKRKKAVRGKMVTAGGGNGRRDTMTGGSETASQKYITHR